jgi:U-box domain
MRSNSRHNCATPELLLPSTAANMSTGLMFRQSNALTGEVVVPNEFTCPITLELLKWPMISKYGHTFERYAILAWLAKESTCPLSRQPLSTLDLRPNYLLMREIQHWQGSHGVSASIPSNTTTSHERCPPCHDFWDDYIARLREGRRSTTCRSSADDRIRWSASSLRDTKNLDSLLDEYDRLESQDNGHMDDCRYSIFKRETEP